jgi:hypothetical protein
VILFAPDQDPGFKLADRILVKAGSSNSPPRRSISCKPSNSCSDKAGSDRILVASFIIEST